MRFCRPTTRRAGCGRRTGHSGDALAHASTERHNVRAAADPEPGPDRRDPDPDRCDPEPEPDPGRADSHADTLHERPLR